VSRLEFTFNKYVLKVFQFLYLPCYLWRDEKIKKKKSCDFPKTLFFGGWGLRGLPLLKGN
jgi:hypothetical protein